MAGILIQIGAAWLLDQATKVPDLFVHVLESEPNKPTLEGRAASATAVPGTPEYEIALPRDLAIAGSPIHPSSKPRGTKMRKMRSVLVVLTTLLPSGSVVLAQQSERPCAGDIKKLCAGIKPGGGRITACIKSHLTDLSPSCESRVLTVAVTRKVCKSDVTRLCAGVVRGTGGIRTCIKSHAAEVSGPCRDAMSRAAAGRKILGGNP